MTSHSIYQRQFVTGCLAALLTIGLTASIRAENREEVASILQRIDEVVAQGPFAADWQSLKSYRVPDWFTDAKFGIYTHWGVYSVPAYHNEWYPRHMYAALADFHREHHGPQSEFGYKDFIPAFHAERWDPEQWAKLCHQAGARFAGTVSQHHDGFAMWDSEVNRWNAGEMGPRRDITGQLAESLRKRNMRVAVTFHHAWNVIGGYYATVRGTDTADPAYADLYGHWENQDDGYRNWLAEGILPLQVVRSEASSPIPIALVGIVDCPVQDPTREGVVPDAARFEPYLQGRGNAEQDVSGMQRMWQRLAKTGRS